MSYEEDKDAYANLSNPRITTSSCRVTLPNTPLPSISKRISKNKIHKKKSRITIAFEKENNDEDTKSSSSNSQEDNLESSGLVSINITVVVGTTLKTVSFVVKNSYQLKVIIQKSIDELNKLSVKEKVLFSLIEDFECYVLKPAKKSGKPNSDMPPFCDDISILDTGSTKLALCWKEDAEEFVSMYERAKPKKLCNNKCIIF